MLQFDQNDNEGLLTYLNKRNISIDRFTKLIEGSGTSNEMSGWE
jgi:hypothetical protein